MRNVVVLGMHRSGTSMVAGALAAAGVFVGNPDELLSDQEDNPNGFWERSDVVTFNDSVLESIAAAWFFPPEPTLSPQCVQQHQREVNELLACVENSAPDHSSWLLKDPRMLVTWPVWVEALHDSVLVYVYRDPCAVAISLHKRNGFPLTLGLALWERYNQAALDIIEAKNALCISFDAVSKDPDLQIARLLGALNAQGVSVERPEEGSSLGGSSYDKKLGDAGRENHDFVTTLLSASQRKLATYCAALCLDAEADDLPERPALDIKLSGVIQDMAGAMAPLASVVETQNELREVSRLCQERTDDRDQSLKQLSVVESDYSALASAHQGEVAQHKELEGLHISLLSKHDEQLDIHAQLEQDHELLTEKAEYLFTDLSATYAKLFDFEQSVLGRLLRVIRRSYKVITGRRGTLSRYDDVMGQARVFFEQHQLQVSDILESAPAPQGKLSLLGDVLKYVAKNPAGSVRSFSLARLKRATSVFLGSNSDDLDVWVNSRFPTDVSTTGAQAIVDPKNLDEALDHLKLVFPIVESPVVSIVIPVYNDYRMTIYCLQALLKNTLDVAYEVILGDDCSTDLTTTIDQRVANITVVRGEHNLGFLGNCNAAAMKARGEHVLFLNNDTGVCSNWLAPLLSSLESNEDVGIVGPKLLFADGKLQEAGGIVWKDGSAWNYGRMDDPGKPEYNYIREVDYISGACLLVRGELWRKLGGFDSRYKPAYYEDTDIAFEARSSGYKVLYQPLSEVFHFEGVSNGTDLESGTKKYQVQNQQKFLEKWSGELEAFHFPNAECVFQARDRSRTKRCVLFIDHYVPHYDKDAGSRSTFMYVKLMVSMGYKVVFLGANYFPHEPYTQVLQQMGVEVLVGEYMARNQDHWLKENAPYIDRIYLHRPHIAEQLLSSLEKMQPRPPIIFFGHDLHYLRIEREEKVVGDPLLGKSAQKWKKREYSVFDRVDTIYYPSQVEVDEIARQRPDLNVKAIPLYILDGTVGASYQFDTTSDLLFVGGFNHPPNVDGICWFVEEVLPLIEKQCPGIKLHVVGSNPTDAVRELHGEGVMVYGYLSDQELADLYRKVRVAVVPLRFGAGVKGKVLEAIQKNVPLVTTAVGAEGIPEVDTVMNIADSAQDFAQSVICLYGGDSDALSKLDNYSDWLDNHFSRKNAISIIAQDFGAPQRELD